MTEVDPRDPVAVAAALRAWAAATFGTPVELAGPPQSVGAGFDSYIHLVALAGPGLPVVWRAPLVVRIVPSADRAERAVAEAAAQGWCADQGFPAPRVLTVLAPGQLLGLPVQVMERVPGVTMLDALKRRPWRALALVDQLAALQLRLHALDVSGWPGSTTTTGLAEVRLSLPRRAVDVLDDPALARALERVEAVVPECDVGAPPVVCHGDFHALNVMVDGAAASVIDWTDAGLGPREADVARTLLLFELAPIAASNGLERATLRVAGPRLARRYRRRYEQGVRLDERLLRRWDALHALHGWAQVALLHSGALDGASSSAGGDPRLPPALAGWLQRRVEADLAAA